MGHGDAMKLLPSLSLCSLLLIACGGADDSIFTGSGDPNAAGPDPNAPGGGFGADEGLPQGTSSACVSSVASATLAPTNLVIMYDKSGSMGDTRTGFDPSKRWTPVGAGMRDFFLAPESKSLQASLQFFPQGGDLAEVCSYGYSVPRVPLASLVDPSAFVQAIDSETPGGGTPTVPALAGAYEYAKSVQAQRPGEKVAIVFVTDGEPGFWNDTQKAIEPGCTNNTIAGAEAIAAQAKAEGVSVHVIGVGPALANLNAIAAAGGTTQAQMVDVGDPTSTKTAFTASLTKIRKDTLSCTFGVPAAPDGKSIDFKAVNVVVTDAAGKERVLGYSASCSDPSGWHYDDLNAPTRVELCASACTLAQAADSARVQLAFGCKTQASPR